MHIVEFEPRHADAFRTLNEAWISKYFVLEPKDREVLQDPIGKIIEKGGRIFMAEQFYDVTNSTRAAIYRAYIRKCLDTFADNSNVIQVRF